MIGFKIILVGVALCALAGCGQKDCREEGAISGMIRDLSIRPVADFSGVYDSVMKICDRIEKSANVTDKGSNYKALATRLANIDFTGLGGNDRTLVFGDYWRSLALVCSRMLADDSLDMERTCPQPWYDGDIIWEIPIAWGRRESRSLVDRLGDMTGYQQIFNIDSFGGVRIDKFENWVKRMPNDDVTHSAGIIEVQ